MTVLTNTNSYSFQLDSLNPKSKPTYKLQFTYPDGGYDAAGSTNAIATFDPEKLNWKYSFTGERSLVPVESFDNGQFTYFKFKKDGMSHVPAIFMVDKEKQETLVNFHVQGDYLVINGIAKQFTLRDGASVTSIYNDLAIGDWKNVA
jgi:type IV secretion system protein VirB9